jgi:hypothetical protein
MVSKEEFGTKNAMTTNDIETNITIFKENFKK